MLELIALMGFLVFTLGLLLGVRCQEINLRRRERRLLGEKRRLNEQIQVFRTSIRRGSSV